MNVQLNSWAFLRTLDLFLTLLTLAPQEIAAATSFIEEKTARVGTVAVEVVNAKQDLEDTQSSLAEDAGYLAGFLKDVLDGASPTTWTPHPSSYNKKILDFLKDDVVGTPREATLWRRATLYNTFAKLQE